MIAGMPGAGKTLLALWYVANMKLDALVFSADSDEHTVRNRVAASLTATPTDEIERMEDVFGEDHYIKQIREGTGNLSFSWEPAPTLDDIGLELLAYEELWGKPPEVVVIDNLMNVVGEGESWEGMKESFKFLHHLARKSNAGVFVLHHTSEAGDSGRKPPNPEYPQPRRHIQGKLSQLPETILTTASDGHHRFRVACVKNRSGPSHPNADSYVDMFVDFPTMTLFDTQQEYAMAQTRRGIQ